jgi:chloramphenicol-sensitive protein RarD
VGVALAGVGVAIETAALHALPWVPLVLAVSFALYGIVRKGAPVDASTGLLIECVILFIPAAILVAGLQQVSRSHFGHSAVLTFFLVIAGPATVAPLAAFAFAARRLPLSVVGVLQFISPTLQFLCGLFEGESIGPASILAFAFIWTGVGVFLYGVLRPRAARTQAPPLRA